MLTQYTCRHTHPSTHTHTGTQAQSLGLRTIVLLLQHKGASITKVCRNQLCNLQGCTDELGLTETFTGLFYFIYLFLAVPGLQCCASFSPAVGSRGCSVAMVRGLRIAVTSVAEQGLQGAGTSGAAAPGLRSTGSGVGGIGLVVPWLVGSFWTRGWTLHWQTDSPPVGPQGSPQAFTIHSIKFKKFNGIFGN